MKIKNGQKVNVHYVGTLSDGTEFDNSRTRGTPLVFELGSGNVLPAFESAIKAMSVGDTKKFSLTADQAYGQPRDEAVQAIPKNRFDGEMELEVGQAVAATTPDGQPIRAIIRSIEDESVTLDFNHPLAGKDINFDVELLSVE